MTGTEISDIGTFSSSAGYGIFLSKCYQADINHVFATNCGVGVALRGCDMTVVSDSLRQVPVEGFMLRGSRHPVINGVVESHSESYRLAVA